MANGNVTTFEMTKSFERNLLTTNEDQVRDKESK